MLTRQQVFENVWGFNEYGDLNTFTKTNETDIVYLLS
ncbi:hypothetical protein [Desulfosporosinus fructosivorans]